MSEKYCARDLAYHYLSRQPEKLSEEKYLAKLVRTEAKFAEILANGNPPDPDKLSPPTPSMDKWA